MSGGFPNEQIAVEQEVVSEKDPLVLSSEIGVEETPTAVPEEKRKRDYLAAPALAFKEG